ncbi:MAG: hypothetical protein ABII02_02605 [Candidatus Magasanikbacteria bacterium]
MKKGMAKTLLKILFVCLFIFLIFWVNKFAFDNGVIKNIVSTFGYTGILFTAVISGFNVVVPVPIIAFFPFFMELGFHPIIAVLVIAFGMSVGDFFGFLIGSAGREVIKPKEGKILKRLEDMREKHSLLPLVFMFFYAAFMPIPNELVVIPLAFLGYRMWKVMTVIFLGNIIFNTIAAFGFTQAFQLF